MRFLPRISISTHGLLELLAGLSLTLAAMVFDLGAAGTVFVFGAGVLLAGIGLGAADAMSLAAHQSLDRTLVVALAAAAIGCAAAGGVVAASLLLATSAAILALEAGTRWTRPAAR